ncbi:MAG: hypothetical protein AAF456_00010 [Planctomycetota bacterium]
MSRLSFNCPQCGELFSKVKQELLGRKFQCKCGKVFRVGSKSDRVTTKNLPAQPDPIPVPLPAEVLPVAPHYQMAAQQMLAPVPAPVSNPPPRLQPVRGVSASKKKVRITHNTVLPRICIKTGKPATRTITNRYYQLGVASIMSLLVGFAGFMLRVVRAAAFSEGDITLMATLIEATIVGLLSSILAFVVFPKRIKVELPLSEHYFVRHQAIAWTLRAILGVCLILEVFGVAGVIFREQLTEQQEMIAGGLVVLPGMAILFFGLVYPRVTRVIRPSKITDEYGEFTGAHPTFLSSVGRTS